MSPLTRDIAFRSNGAMVVLDADGRIHEQQVPNQIYSIPASERPRWVWHFVISAPPGAQRIYAPGVGDLFVLDSIGLLWQYEIIDRDPVTLIPRFGWIPAPTP